MKDLLWNELNFSFHFHGKAWKSLCVQLRSENLAHFLNFIVLNLNLVFFFFSFFFFLFLSLFFPLFFSFSLIFFLFFRTMSVSFMYSLCKRLRFIIFFLIQLDLNYRRSRDRRCFKWLTLFKEICSKKEEKKRKKRKKKKKKKEKKPYGSYTNNWFRRIEIVISCYVM